MRYQEDAEVGGLRKGRSSRRKSREDREGSDSDVPHTMAAQLRAVVTPAIQGEPLALPEINMNTQPDPNVVPLHGSEGQHEPVKAKKPVPVIDAPHGTVTMEAGGYTTVIPLKPEERDGFVNDARAKMASEVGRDRYVKVASVASSVLSFAALGLLLVGGFAAVRNAKRGDE